MTGEGEQAELDRLIRRAEHLVRREELADRIASGKKLRVKLGLDPTARDVTLGWAVPLRKLRDFQDAGHTAVLILGDFTARIGDPSGKSETRPQLSAEEVKGNAEACLEALLDVLSEDNLEVRYNSEWLQPMDMSDILRLTARYTVAQMLERDDFSKRYTDNRPISLVEFMYPLLQGYDSVAVQADVELGGTDQLFNLLVGRDLQKAYGQQPQVAMTLPLLEGLDGVQKMSQSLKNYIAIREKPDVMFGQLMSIPDQLIGRYALLTTNLDADAVADLEAAARTGGRKAGEAKRTIARSVVSIYHGQAAAAAAEAAFDRQFKQHEAPEDLAEFEIPASTFAGDGVSLPRLLESLGWTKSRSEARKLILNRGIRVNGSVFSDEFASREQLDGAVFQAGKRRFARLHFGASSDA